MRRVIDFDAKFFEYAQGWLAMRPGLTEKQAEESYNKIMLDWLNAPAKWLDGETPGTYFNRYEDPKEIGKLLTAYLSGDIGLPEPLYNRVVALGDVCVDELIRLAKAQSNPEPLRSTTLGLLRDIGTDKANPLCVEILCEKKVEENLAEIAADILAAQGENQVDELLKRYPNVSEEAQMLILDVLCNFSGDERIYKYVEDKFINAPEHRALYASFLAKLGDERAIAPLKAIAGMSDLSYFDYIEVRNAIEQLGGEVEEERVFDGDPDYEAMRNL